MAETWLLVLAAVLAVSALSFTGALTLAAQAFRHHAILLILVAFAAGSLLGDAFLHLIPESVEAFEGLTPRLGGLIIGGFLVFFLLEAALRWTHTHGGHVHTDAGHVPPGAGGRIAPFAMMNLIGDGLHNFVDGVLIAATFLVDPALGVATTIAVAAHEIPQELGDFAVLLRGGFEVKKALLYNLVSALMAVAGAVLMLVAPLDPEVLEKYIVPLIAGGFIYIAASDLVPELHHHARSRLVPGILMGILAGVAVMALLLRLE